MTVLPGNGPLATIARWTLRFTAFGTAFGVLLMLTKTPIMAESGGKPDDVLKYSFWVPMTAVFGSVLGAGFGVLAVIWGKLKEWAGLR